MRIVKIALITAIVLVVLFKIYLLITAVSYGANNNTCDAVKLVNVETICIEITDKRELKKPFKLV